LVLEVVAALYGGELLFIGTFNHRQLVYYHMAAAVGVFLCRIDQLKGDLIVALRAPRELLASQ
jgi:hypothetical protein